MVIATDQIANDEVVELSPPESSTSPILLNKNQSDEYDDEDDLECDTDEEMHLHNSVDPAAAALDTTGGSSSMNNEQLKEAHEDDEVDEDEGGSLHSDMSASKSQSGNPKSMPNNNSNYVYVNRKELRKLQLSIHQIQSQQTLQMNLIEQIQLQLNSCIKTQNEYKTIAEQHMNLLGKEQQQQQPTPLNPKLALASETLLKNTTNSIKNLNSINNKLLAKQQAVPANPSATSSSEPATTNTTTSTFNELNNYKSKKLMAAASLHNKKKELENFEYHQKQQQQQQQQQQEFENNDESEPNMSDDYEDYEEVDFQKSAKRFKPNKPAPQQQVII